ncbi:MAG: hypothetical protein HYX92_17675 [Chloroflexi bacterium]|nr:hypothetical protein [Chloroflexota bacterium]
MASTEKMVKETWLEQAGRGMAPGDWAWLLQRVTAVLIAGILVVHLWIQHFATVGEPITFKEVSERLRNPLFLGLDVVLLGAGLFHGINGVRAIILDFGIGPRGAMALNVSLIIVGVMIFGFGLMFLVPFLFGRWPLW